MDWNSILLALITAGTILIPVFLKLRADRRKDEAATALRAEEEKEEKARYIKKQSLGFNTEFDLRIKHIENRIYKYTLFMRSFVINFYNGEVTISRLPIIKVIFRHEVTQGYFVKRVTENFQGRPTPAMFESMIRRVLAEGHYYLEDFNSLIDKDQPGNNLELYEWLLSYGAKSMLCVEIKNTNTDEPVAILVMHFPAIRPLNNEQIVNIKEDKKDIEHYYSEL